MLPSYRTNLTLIHEHLVDVYMFQKFHSQIPPIRDPSLPASDQKWNMARERALGFNSYIATAEPIYLFIAYCMQELGPQ